MAEYNKVNNDIDDQDALTNAMVFNDYKTWSKGHLRRQKLLSMMQGRPQPSRKKIFSEIRMNEDLDIYNTEVQKKTIRCAKIFNPAMFCVKKNDTTWALLEHVQRLEIEDPTGILTTVPKQIATDLHQLESLTINWTKIRSLPERLFQLPLKSLYLQRNNIRSLTSIENAADTLTILDVSNNCINSLPKSFGQLRNLITLNISGNNLHELPPSIGQLSGLKTLDASSNKLKQLPPQIGLIIDLTTLDVSNNRLERLTDSLSELPNLEDIRASSNRLTSLPVTFNRLVRLSSLILRSNQLTEVPTVLGGLTNLISLNMRDNLITRMDTPVRSLQYLVLDDNQVARIDDGILQCVNLQLLSLQNNELTSVPREITRLQKLRSLLLSQNNITEVPSELASLGLLSNLNLSANNIVTVPAEVAQLPHLTSLNLDECPDLDHYLKLADKERGLPGVVDYLLKKEGTEPRTGDVSDYSNLSPDGDSAAATAVFHKNVRDTMMPLEEDPRVGYSQHSAHAKAKQVIFNDRQTIMFGNEAQLMREDNGAIGNTRRQQAGLSIVSGRTSPTRLPPMDVDGQQVKASTSNNPRKVEHIARKTLHPETFEMSAMGNGQAAEAGMRSKNKVRVIQTLDSFGDLVSSSTDATFSGLSGGHGSTVAKPPVVSKKPSVAAKPSALVNTTTNDEDDEDLSQLYASIIKKSNPQPQKLNIDQDTATAKDDDDSTDLYTTVIKKSDRPQQNGQPMKSKAVKKNAVSFATE